MLMDKKSPLAKRIKRHVSGRQQSFFASTAPGLETLCYNELICLPLSSKEASIVEGGVQFKGRIQDCYLANLNLRIPNRILMRIAEFKASNFRTLEKKIAAVPWELFTHQGVLPEIKITSKHSRLYHKTAVADRIKKNIATCFDQPNGSSAMIRPDGNLHAFPQQLFVRAVDDRFTLSLDSSGDLLYKRGIKEHSGSAPLRETIAAAALHLAGYDPSAPLLDPMCGSGTFSLEGAMISQNIPAGWFRNFAFMGWPCFKQRQWNHLKREAQKHLTPVNPPLIFASDKDEKVCKTLANKIDATHFSGAVRVFCKNFLDLSPYELTDKPGLIVINPPYGLRLGNRQESKALFRAVIHKLKTTYTGWKLAIIVPDKSYLKAIPFSLSSHQLFHGGLRITLLYGKIK